MRTRTLLWPYLLTWILMGCEPTTNPVEGSTPPPYPLSTDTLRYSIPSDFTGRTVIAHWYHTSFSNPLASRTLANRPLGQAFPVSSAQGILVLPADLDTLFDFNARLRQFLLDEGGVKSGEAILDSASLMESRHWAMAPLVVAGSDELARLTFAQSAAGTKLSDTSGLSSGMVLLWVRDSLVAEKEGILARRKLSGKFRRGWHLLRYFDSGRRLEPASLKDTVIFSKDAPEPNLV